MTPEEKHHEIENKIVAYMVSPGLIATSLQVEEDYDFKEDSEGVQRATGNGKLRITIYLQPK
jgi:hypothetical protein